jgi:phosphatidylglycerol---prolipoprotein diacylglyceryl transferase
VFELLAYSGGFQLYRWLRRREGDVVSTPTRWSVVVAAAVGGALGSRLLAALEQPAQLTSHWIEVLLLSGGKTIVGGLIGGVIAVEWAKRRLRITSRTGDLFAAPLAAGIAVGRIGCFLSGLDDGTFGTPTAMWSGIDFGDGIPRHPTQLYELAFLLVLAAALTRPAATGLQQGDRFRLFMVGYMAFRLAVDAIKPDPKLALGLSSIQWACAATLLYYLPDITRWLTTPALLRPQRHPHALPGSRSAP